jgi:hypothetical protein
MCDLVSCETTAVVGLCWYSGWSKLHTAIIGPECIDSWTVWQLRFVKVKLSTCRRELNWGCWTSGFCLDSTHVSNFFKQCKLRSDWIGIGKMWKGCNESTWAGCIGKECVVSTLRQLPHFWCSHDGDGDEMKEKENNVVVVVVLRRDDGLVVIFIPFP